MESVGKRLKAAREKRQMSVSDVASEINARAQIIEAIEKDDFSSMVAPVYAKGFIKLYAECVELDHVPLIKFYSMYHVSGAGKQTASRPITQLEEKGGRGQKWIRSVSDIRWPRVKLPKINVKILSKVKHPAASSMVSSHTENVRHFPASFIWQLGAKLKSQISRFKNRKRQDHCSIHIKTLRHLSLPRWTGQLGAVFVKIPKIEVKVLSQIRWPSLTMPKKLLSRLQLPVETWKTVLSIAAVCVLVAAAVIGVFRYSRRSDPNRSEFQWIQEPPAPYIGPGIKGGN